MKFPNVLSELRGEIGAYEDTLEHWDENEYEMNQAEMGILLREARAAVRVLELVEKLHDKFVRLI